MNMNTAAMICRGALFALCLLILGGLAPAVRADDPRVYIPLVQPAGKMGEDAILGRVETLSIKVESADITRADEFAVATMIDSLKQSLVKRLTSVKLDGDDAFSITPDRAPHLLKITARMKSETKELNYFTEEVDHDNCIRKTTDDHYYEVEDRDAVVGGGRGRARISESGGQIGFGSRTEECEEFGVKQVQHQCTVDHIRYSGQTELVENKRRGRVLYSRTFAHSQMPESCEREEQTESPEISFAEKFASDIRNDFAPHRIRASSPLDLRRPKKLEKSHRKTWKRYARILEEYRGREVTRDELWWSGADPKRWSGTHAVLKQACDFFEQIKDGSSADSAIVLYNRGLCAEYDGRLDDAEKLYQTAQTAPQDMKGRGGRRLLKRIVEALGRIEIQRTNREEAFGQLGAIAKR
ncbi:MAG: hypothetical protein ISN29_12550 [Gammaproteobacteria bacterium AqS3]|nr:hypothetical protein [Gammaproteobacteria bacterium AqS3]